MTQAAISGWEGGERLYRLEMARLNLVPKRWGPFEYADCFDLAVRDCRLQVHSEALGATLKHVGETLLPLGRRSQPPALPDEASEASELQNSPGMTPTVRLIDPPLITPATLWDPPVNHGPHYGGSRRIGCDGWYFSWC